VTPTVFLLSPATLGGERAAMLLDPRARFEVARQVRSPGGAALGDVFTFLSGLYFRGKLTYARAFARPSHGLPGALVITAGEGLRYPEERVTAARLERWAGVPVDQTNPHFTGPLVAHAEALAAADDRCEVVLLGSVATGKYVDPLLHVFGKRLLFPSEFVGRGDMSRGALLLRAARAGKELPYAPVLGATRRGARAAGVSRATAATKVGDASPLGGSRKGR